MPSCCTMSIITGFGESEYAGNGSLNPPMDEGQMIYALERFISNSSYMATLIATTNSDQVTAMAALRAVGFISTRPMTKRQHPRTTVRLWHYKINQPAGK